jgi:hypothetical protein
MPLVSRACLAHGKVVASPRRYSVQRSATNVVPSDIGPVIPKAGITSQYPANFVGDHFQRFGLGSAEPPPSCRSAHRCLQRLRHGCVLIEVAVSATALDKEGLGAHHGRALHASLFDGTFGVSHDDLAVRYGQSLGGVTRHPLPQARWAAARIELAGHRAAAFSAAILLGSPSAPALLRPIPQQRH